MKQTTLLERIRSAGFRATKPRLAILTHITEAKYPLSIQEIHSALRRSRIDQVTVYRVIEAFTAAGILREIATQHGVQHYEYNDLEHDHDHIVCGSCHKIEDISNLHKEGIERTALKKSHSFSTINAHALTLYGVCNACAA